MIQKEVARVHEDLRSPIMKFDYEFCRCEKAEDQFTPSNAREITHIKRALKHPAAPNNKSITVCLHNSCGRLEFTHDSTPCIRPSGRYFCIERTATNNTGSLLSTQALLNLQAIWATDCRCLPLPRAC
eukprot:11451606-Karenia_brevis.AAC.1